MIIPEDGCLPPLTRKGFAAFNNVMLIKVPEKLRKPEETCYQLATLDRSKKGERWPADQYVDIIMNTPISKESNEEAKTTSSPANNKVLYKGFKGKNVFRPERLKSCPENFTGFPRRNQQQEPRPVSCSTAPYNNDFDSHNRPPLSKSPFVNPQMNRPPPTKSPYNHQINRPPPSKSPFNNPNSDFNPHINRPPPAKSPYNNPNIDFNPQINRPPPSKSPYNNPNIDFNHQINRPPPSKSPLYFCNDFNPHNNPPNPILNNFQGVPPQCPPGFAPNPNVQWDRNNAANYPFSGHDEIRGNVNYEAFPTNHPNRQDFSMPPYPHSVEPGMNNSFNNPRNDYPPPMNYGDNIHPQFNNQPYPFQYENYGNTQDEQYGQDGDYNNAHNVRKNFNNFSYQQNAQYPKNHGDGRRPYRGNRGNKYSWGNKNRRGRNYQRRDFQDSHGNEENPSQFQNDGPQ